MEESQKTQRYPKSEYTLVYHSVEMCQNLLLGSLLNCVEMESFVHFFGCKRADGE